MASKDNYRSLILKKIEGHGHAIGLSNRYISAFCALCDFWEKQEPIADPIGAYHKVCRMMDIKKLDLEQRRRKAEKLKEAAEEKPAQDLAYIDEQL